MVCAEEPATGTDERPWLIVADDCADLRWLISNALAGLVSRVIEACDGRQLFTAMEAAYRSCCERPHGTIVLADVKMPAYEGLDVLEAWAKAYWQFPFVVMTGFPDADVASRAQRIGAQVLPKPFTLFQLRSVIEGLATNPPACATPASAPILSRPPGSRTVR